MKKTIAEVGAQFFANKRVLMRVDFNVPLNDDRSIADDARIRAALPSITFLKEAKAKIVLMSHLGRPKGATPKLTLKPVAERLKELLGGQVLFAEDCIGAAAQAKVSGLRGGDICLLENLRFHPEEEKNDSNFARSLAELGDIYVDDAFGTVHRAHASTEGITHFLRPALAGLLLDREVKTLSETLNHPARPFATVIGGAKVSTKIGVLDHLLSRVDVLVIGGAMAFSFLKAQGREVGKSLVEEDQLSYCQKLLAQAHEKGVKLILPVDLVCAPEIKATAKSVLVACDQIPKDMMGLDVGPNTIEKIRLALEPCKTILWNGPLGVFEVEGFEKGTYALIDQLLALTKAGAKVIVGGGDSVSALTAKGVDERQLTHVSTGGGASLEFLEGLELPGIACLDEAETPAVSKR